MVLFFKIQNNASHVEAASIGSWKFGNWNAKSSLQFLIWVNSSLLWGPRNSSSWRVNFVRMIMRSFKYLKYKLFFILFYFLHWLSGSKSSFFFFALPGFEKCSSQVFVSRSTADIGPPTWPIPTLLAFRCACSSHQNIRFPFLKRKLLAAFLELLDKL